MSKSWKRTEVTIETEMLVIFRRGAETLRAWCARCGAESLMLTPDAAASLSGVTPTVIYARVKSGSIHFIELPGGVPLICASSVGVINHE